MSEPLVMGILNVTPDSFFDGGRYLEPAAAIGRAREMVAEGADIVDVGGESTRPGAEPVEEREELRRILPVVSALSAFVRVSIDTTKPAVARAALGEGASLLNDVGGSLAPLAAESGAGLVVTHHQGTPKHMQDHPHYEDVVAEVRAELAGSAARARELGVGECYVDPGIGFGKTGAHNLSLLGALPELVADGEPVLVGTSRKAFLGRLAAGSDRAPLPPAERLPGSIATAVWAMLAGAAIVRVHDVGATVRAARLLGGHAGSLVPALAGAAR